MRTSNDSRDCMGTTSIELGHEQVVPAGDFGVALKLGDECCWCADLDLELLGTAFSWNSLVQGTR
jgi:hypothetical protein